ncbi:CDP-alcohol phosphatidyltransferase family protein [Agromyces atrinae]|uniref:CDP-alcohol phosphatidyltransferase family protein n=1 Tax=Agromyces atrinae TaxID=592376 RepID=UPI001F568714|nr:CDP-alcohol phosphatidyltransferase family protein [Agromyces atrinae]MCI2956166.1 CDP-alcohol phosphatidyltransferase family protein [Agromyces atrinae]
MTTSSIAIDQQHRERERYRDVVARLASAQKKAAPGSPAYSVYVNRRAGRYIAAAAYLAGLRPNGVTAISALFTFSGIAVLAFVPSGVATGIAVWLLLAIGYAFDSADGQVARLLGGGSAAGEWLDHVVDCLKIVSLHLAVLFWAVRTLGVDSPWLLVPLGFTIVNTVSFFAMILNDQLKTTHALRHGASPAPVRSASTLRSLIVLPTDFGVLCLSFVLLGFTSAFTLVYALLFVASLGHLLLASASWFRAMKRLDSPLPTQ